MIRSNGFFGLHQKLREKPPLSKIASKNPEGNIFFHKDISKIEFAVLAGSPNLVPFPRKKCAPHMRNMFCQSVQNQIRKLVVLFVSLSQTTFLSSFFQMQCGNVTTPENKALGPTPFPCFFKFWGLTKPEPHLFLSKAPPRKVVAFGDSRFAQNHRWMCEFFGWAMAKKSPASLPWAFLCCRGGFCCLNP